jgi:hypothetical protein
MSFQAALARTSLEVVGPLEHVQRHIPVEWVEHALACAGTATLRRRRLPAEQVVWLVIGIGLFRDRSIEQVVESLGIALPSPQGPVAKSAIPAARARVGEAPLQWLFERTAAAWASTSAIQHRWRGLALYGIDGTSLRTADTETNRKEFGGWVAGRGDSSNPLLRLVVLIVLRSHLIAAARFGSYAQTSELGLAEHLLTELPEQSLTIVDALYVSRPFLSAIEAVAGRQWLTKAKSNTRMRVLERYTEGDERVEMTTSDEARAKDPALPPTWIARAIRYQRPGFPPRTLLTSLLDAAQYPAREIRDLYHERWESELAYDELKTEMLEAQPTLRSKSPPAVRQEVWGVLLGFNLVRLEMEGVAKLADVDPCRISFVATLLLVRDTWFWAASSRSPGALPKQLQNARQRLKRFVLPPRRSHRRYPREIKNDYRRYPRRRINTLAK